MDNWIVDDARTRIGVKMPLEVPARTGRARGGVRHAGAAAGRISLRHEQSLGGVILFSGRVTWL